MLRRRADDEAHELVADCEDVLRGAYAERRLRAGASVPPWAWLNVLAHGTLEELRALGQAQCPHWVWPRARWFLVGEVLDAVDSGASSLRTLQREVLIPLELRAACEGSGWGPSDLVRETRRQVQGGSRSIRSHSAG
jgi:hypothetical protein